MKKDKVVSAIAEAEDFVNKAQAVLEAASETDNADHGWFYTVRDPAQKKAVHYAGNPWN